MDMTAAIQYILTTAQSLGSQVYYKKSRMMTLGLAGVLFWENEQAKTKLIVICSEENTYLDAREATGCLKATVGNRVKPDYHINGIVFRSFLFLSARFLCSLEGYMLKSTSAHIGHCGPKLC